MQECQAGERLQSTKWSFFMDPIRRQLQPLACLLLVACSMTCLAQATTPASLMVEDLFRMTNAARSEHRLAPLQWDDSLAQAARSHAELLLQTGQFSHELPREASLAVRAAQAGAHFQAIAENIAEGPGVDSIQRSWMNSPPHRANILDTNLNSVGFAVVGHGSYFYAVADFSRTVPILSFEEVESAVGKLLLARGIRSTASMQDARQSCEMEHGAVGGSKPLFIMRWQGADLSRLPDRLEDQLRTHSYRTAAIGACASANAGSGFTTYRIAVLLY
jgi:Cysteine-rich secretory protein family